MVQMGEQMPSARVCLQLQSHVRMPYTAAVAAATAEEEEEGEEDKHRLGKVSCGQS